MSGFYRNQDLEAVRSASDIVSLIGEDNGLAGGDGRFYCDCPMCGGKDALAVSGREQLFNCVDCGESGDVFYYAMKAYGLSFNDSVAYLARRAGMEPPAMQDASARERLYYEMCAVNSEAGRYFYGCLANGRDRAGLNYFREERGLDDATIRRFGLGYCPKPSDGLYRHLKEKGFSDKIMEDAGLVSFKNGPYDRMSGRVMYPIFNADGECVAFSGRVLDDSGDRRKGPKYLSTKETMLFDKKNTLFALNFAKDHMENGAILCEGNMDAISLHRYGFASAVASLGTAFGEGGAAVLSRYTDRVHLAFDGDSAGMRAALRTIPFLKEAGFGVDVVDLSPCKDPDEFLRTYGGDAFLERLERAEPAVDFEVRSIAGDRGDVMERFAGKLVRTPERYRGEYAEAMNAFLQARALGREKPRRADRPREADRRDAGDPKADDRTGTGSRSHEPPGRPERDGPEYPGFYASGGIDSQEGAVMSAQEIYDAYEQPCPEGGDADREDEHREDERGKEPGVRIGKTWAENMEVSFVDGAQPDGADEPDDLSY